MLVRGLFKSDLPCGDGAFFECERPASSQKAESLRALSEISVFSSRYQLTSTDLPNCGVRQVTSKWRTCPTDSVCTGEPLSAFFTRSAVQPKPRELRWLACAWTKMREVRKVPGTAAALFVITAI